MLHQSLEAAVEKYPKAACHEKPPSSSRNLSEENWKKSGGKLEENWRNLEENRKKTGGKHFENSLKKSIKKQDQNGAKKKNV